MCSMSMAFSKYSDFLNQKKIKQTNKNKTKQSKAKQSKTKPKTEKNDRLWTVFDRGNKSTLLVLYLVINLKKKFEDSFNF